MTDTPDKLDAIKARLGKDTWSQQDKDDADWLIAEVERLQMQIEALEERRDTGR